MADSVVPTLRQLVSLMQGITGLVIEHQAHVLALEAYLERQAGYDAQLFAVLFQQYKTDSSGQLARELQSAVAALEAALGAFEGPVH